MMNDFSDVRIDFLREMGLIIDNEKFFGHVTS